MMEEHTPAASLNFYSLFTKYSLMEEYGFSSGLRSRLFRKLLPIVPDRDTAAYVLLYNKEGGAMLLEQLMFDDAPDERIVHQLDLSISALCSKIVAFGLDSNIKAKYDFLQLNALPFEQLLEKVNHLTVNHEASSADLISILERVEHLITELRKNKNKIGTNFHLTIVTRRILDYAQRIKELYELKMNISSKKYWENLFDDYVDYAKSKDSIRRYLNRQSDLVALEIVEHTANKGEKYIADDRKAYRKFFYKSLLGGGIIALFAIIKIIVDSYDLSVLQNAFLFSTNYALCFIIVKQFGGIIATKQPAMTASTIAEHIDRGDNLQIDSLQSIVLLVRKVFRSQFISVMGNFLMAFIFACLIMYVFQLAGWSNLTSIVKPDYLIKNVLPSTQLVFFAAIAGCFLALSGLISGYFDNKVVVSKIAYRIKNHSFFSKNKSIAYFLEKNTGSLLGNVALGFFLGSVFLLTYLLPFKVDIRHIAFSTANVGYAVMNQQLSAKIIALALIGALLIGFINFLISFAITLFLALKSRGANFKLIPNIIFTIVKDFIRHPMYYFFKMEETIVVNQQSKKS